MGIKDFTNFAVASVAAELFEEFLRKFEELINQRNDELEIEKLSDKEGIRVLRLEMPDSAMSLVHKERYAIDLAAQDPSASLIPIDKDTFDDLLEKASVVEVKYAEYKEVKKGDFAGRYAVGMPAPSASMDEERYMLETCIKIIDTLDGKEIHYRNLNRKTFDKVTIVCDDETFLVAFTMGSSSPYGSTTIHGNPKKFSKAVSAAMRTALDLLKSKLKNSLPLEMQLILPRLQQKFDSLSPEDKAEFLNEMRRRAGLD